MQRKLDLSMTWMRRGIIGATFCSLAFTAGCQTATGTGALAGGALGAGIGALVGGRSGAAAGALIGGGAGAITGSVVDANHEKKPEQAQATAQANALAARGGPLQLEDIASMTKSGVGDTVIVNQIRQTNVQYLLNVQQIEWLHASGVSDYVISEMQASGGSRVIYRPRYVYSDGPQAVGYVGVRVR